MDSNDNLIRQWKNAKEASNILNINRGNINSCCKKRYKTAGGYKWMYKEDYDKMIEEQNDLSVDNTIIQ